MNAAVFNFRVDVDGIHLNGNIDIVDKDAATEPILIAVTIGTEVDIICAIIINDIIIRGIRKPCAPFADAGSFNFQFFPFIEFYARNKVFIPAGPSQLVSRIGLPIVHSADEVIVDAPGIIRHRDLIHHAVDRNLHPLRAAERPVRGDDPFAGFIGRGEQTLVAYLHSRDRAGQTESFKDFGHGNGRATGQHVLHYIIGKLHLIDGEAVRLHRNRGFAPVGGFLSGLRGSLLSGLRGSLHVQTFSSHLAGALFLSDMENLGFQVLIRHFRQGKRHTYSLPLLGLDFLARQGVDDFDIKGVGNGDILIFVADFVDGVLRLSLLIHRHTGDRQNSICREHAGTGLHSHNHTVNSP